MSWSRRTALVSLIGLGACGFQPVLVDGSAATALIGNLGVDVQDGRENFEFRARLLDRLGSASDGGRYYLEYRLVISESVVTVSTDAAIERYTLIGTVDYELLDRNTNTYVFSDSVRSSSGYSATADTFPTRVAERDARTRLVESLADQVIQVLQLNADSFVE